MKCHHKRKIMPTIFLWDRFSSDICQNEYFCKFCIFTIAINSSRCKYQQFEVWRGEEGQFEVQKNIFQFGSKKSIWIQNSKFQEYFWYLHINTEYWKGLTIREVGHVGLLTCWPPDMLASWHVGLLTCDYVGEARVPVAHIPRGGEETSHLTNFLAFGMLKQGEMLTLCNFSSVKTVKNAVSAGNTSLPW